jgi:Spy/CpxP family protein refolding chaperone
MKLKLAAFTLSLAALAYAQFVGRGMRGAAADRAAGSPQQAVRTYLTLTDSQMAGLQAIRQTAQTAAEPLLEQLRAKQQALRVALNQTTVDAAAINALRAEITVLEERLKRIRDDARAQMMALLGPEQKAKLATLEAAAALHAEIQGAAAMGLLEGPGPGFGPGAKGRGKGGSGAAAPGAPAKSRPVRWVA